MGACWDLLVGKEQEELAGAHGHPVHGCLLCHGSEKAAWAQRSTCLARRSAQASFSGSRVSWQESEAAMQRAHRGGTWACSELQRQDLGIPAGPEKPGEGGWWGS